MNSIEEPKSKLVRFYQERFLPAYADVVLLYQDKPLEIVLELESAFVHLMNAEALKNPTENLEKARGHIYRSTLDCYKLIWLKISDEINEVAP